MIRRQLPLAVLALLLAPRLVAGDDSAAADPKLVARTPAIRSAIDREFTSLEALYKDLHTHPELSLMEVRTAARMADELRKVGFDVTTNVGGTGVVAVLKNGPGPTVMVRTDLDALPVTEKTGRPYASTF